MDLFDLFAKISIDTSDFERGLDTASKKFKSFSDNIKSISDGFGKVSSGLGDLLSPVVKGFELTEGVGKKAGSAIVSVMKGLGAASTAAAGGAVAVGKSAFDAYANYEQLVGGIETLFKDSAWEVMGYAQTAYKTAGMSANEYMDLTTSFAASLLQSLGGDTAAAAKMADMAASDMADNWNKMGSEARSVQDAYRGFAKQNFTMLDNLKLGYGGTKEEMSRLLADAEKFSGIKYDLSSYADIVSAIHVIQEEMEITGTTAKEASTTIQGSVSSMKAAWDNFKIGLSTADYIDDYKALADDLSDAVLTAGKNVLPRIQEIIERVSDIVPWVVKSFSEIIPEFARMGGEIIETLASGLSAQVPALMEFGSKAVGWIADGIRNNGASVGNSITGFLIEAIDMIGSQSGRLIEAGVVIKNSIANGFENLIDAVTPYISEFVPLLASSFMAYHETLFTVGLDILGAIGQGLTQNKDEIKTVATETIYSMVTALRDNAPAIIEGGIALLEALVGAIMENMPLILETGAEIIGQLVAGISTASPAVQTIIGTAVLPHILKIIDVAGGIGEVFSGVFALVKDGIGAVMDIGGKLMGGIQSIFGLIMAHPVVAVVTAIIAAVVLLWQNCEEFRDAVGAIWDAIVGFFQKAAELIKAAFDGVVGFFAGVWEGIQNIFSAVAEVLGGFFRAAADAVQTAWNAVVDFFKAVWDGIQSVFSVVADVLSGFFSAAWDAIKGVWDGVADFFRGVWDSIRAVFETVAEVLSGFFRAAVEAIQSAWSGVVEFFSGVWSGIQGVFSTVAEVLGGFFRAAWEAVKGVWEAAKEFFGGIADGIREVFESVSEFLGETFRAAWEAVQRAWEGAKEFFSGLWNAVKEAASSAAENIGSALKSAWDAVQSAWNGAKDFFGGVWESIKGVFSDALSHFKDIGKNIMEGLWNGISDKVSWVKDKVGGVVNSIKNAFTGKDGFDEHSPSKWANQVFRYVMEGGVNGLDAGSNNLMREVDSIIGKVKSGMDFGTTTIGVTAVGSNGGAESAYGYSPDAPNQRSGDIYNFYSPKALDPVSAAREMKKAKQQMALGY